MTGQESRLVERLLVESRLHRYSRRRFMGRAATLGLSAAALSAAVIRFESLVSAQEPEPTGSIVISLASEPITLEAWHAYSTIGVATHRNCYEALLNRDPVSNELIGELATAWEWVDDSTIDFTLREGVTFHNGDSLTAEDAAVSLNWTWSAENGFDIIQFMGPQITAEAVDTLTLRVSTAEPDPILPNRLYFSPLSSGRQITESPDTLANEAIGTGPYQVTEWARGEHMTMTAFENWWGRTAADAMGSQSIKDIEWVWREESTVRASQVTAGEAHLARFLAPLDCESLPGCLKAASIETPTLRLDTMHVAMSDIRIREAIGLSVDKQTLADQIFGGADVATQMVGPSAAGYNPDLEALPFDLDGAIALVEEAAADGVPVDAEITVAVRQGAYPGVEEMGEYVAGQLVAAGLNAKAEIIEPAAYEEQFSLGYDNISPDRGWIGTNSHGNEMMDVGQTAPGYYACTGAVSTFCDEEITQMVLDALPLTGEERATAFMGVTAAFMEHIPVVPLVHLPNYYGVAESLTWAPRLDGFMLVKEMTLAS